MIYLGEQLRALEWYFGEMKCRLAIKLIGKQSRTNPGGYHCSKTDCHICSRSYRAKQNVSLDFRNLIYPKIDEILKGNPRVLSVVESQLINDWRRNGFGSETDFKREASKLFPKEYENWFQEKKINYGLAEHLDQHTCVYCNRQYVFTVRKSDNERGIICQFDHWFSQKDHPLLALSFYNLIPSCSACNSAIKSAGEFSINTHLHPYLDKRIMHSFKFSYKLNKVEEPEICVKDFDRLSQKTKTTLDDLGTELVYKGHSSKELQDLIDLRYKYSKNYLEILLNETFKDALVEGSNPLQMSKEEVYRLVFGIELDDKNMHRRPFSKFKKDIISELLENT